MANRRFDPVSYRPFRAEPLLADGLLAVERPGGDLERVVADTMMQIASSAAQVGRRLGVKAEQEQAEAGELAGQLAALEGRPGLTVRGGDLVNPDGSAKPFKTNDPVATDLPPEARALLNGIAGGESGGQYNVRFTPRGGMHFDDLSKHPRIFEQGPHGKSSAAGRYQFTASTWDAEGGGDFSPANQDRKAWGLAQKRYRGMTGRDLLTDLKTEGLSTRIQSVLTPTWQAFKANRGRHAATYSDSLTRFVGAGTAAPPPTGAGTAGVDPSVQAPKVTPAEPMTRSKTGSGQLRPFRAGEFIRNNDGSVSTERTVTIQDSNGKWLNVPTLWATPDGYVDLAEDESRLNAAVAQQEGSGSRFQRFDTLKQAESAARARSDAGGASPSNAPTKGGRTPVTVEASGGTWRPRDGRDAYSRAYNAAGARTYLQALNLEIEKTTAQIADKYADDPAGMQAAMQDLKAEQLREHVFDTIRADYELTFDRRAGALVMQAQRNLDRRAEQQNLADFKGRTVELEDSVNRQLTGLDPADDAAVASLHATQRQLDDHYDAAVAHGMMTPDDAREAKRSSRNATASGYYLAQARDMNPEELAAYRQKLREDYAQGRLDGVTDHAALDAALARQGEAQARGEAQALAALEARRDMQVARIEAGFDPDPAEVGKLRLEQNTAPGGAATVAAAEKRITIARTVRDLPLPEARAYVANLRKALPGDASNEAIANVAYGEQRVAALEKLATADPVGYELATGRLKLEPIDFSADEAGLAQGLAARRFMTAPVAQKYGRPIEVLRPAERELVTRMIAEQPAMLPKLARAMRQGLGEDAFAALREISEDAPSLAHAAGVAIATGSDAVVEEVAIALSAKAQGLWKLKMPEAAKLAGAAGPAFAGALAFHNETRAAVLQTAALLYEREANIFGFDPSKVNDPEEPAAVAWLRALERALGADFRNGRKTGGLGEVNGSAIVVPAGMDATLPQRLVSRINDDMLAKLPPIRSGNGVDISAAQLRRARLVNEGDGVYRVALGDPLSFDPQYVIGADGDFWRLDLRQLEGLTGSGSFYEFMQKLAP